MSTNLTYNDKELLQLIATDDHSAFATLLERHRSNVFGHAMLFLKDQFKAQDIVQEVFLSIWNSRKTLPVVENPENFLFILARNKIVSEFRKKIHLPLEDSLGQIPLSGAPDRNIENKQLLELVQRAVNQMPPQRRIVYELSKKEGLKYDEIATRLAISPNTVKVHMVQALAFIRQFIQDKEPFLLVLCFLNNYFPHD